MKRFLLLMVCAVGFLNTQNSKTVPDVEALKKRVEELTKKLQEQETKPAEQVKAPEKKVEEPAPEKVVEKKEEPKPAAAPEPKPEAAPEPEKKPTGSVKDLVMGVSLDLTKGAKVLGERLKAGLNLAFDQVNAAGGIDGQKTQLVVLDDEYTPEKARANVERIMKEFKTSIMFSPSGSPTVQAYLDLVKDGKLIVLFPNTGAPIFRKPELTYMLHFRPSYFEEGRALVNYAMKEMGASKYALFYQDDAYGQGALEGGRAALKAAGIGPDKFIEIPYKRNDVNFGDQAKKIKDEKADTILFYSTSIAAKGLINAVGVSAMVGKKLLGLSDLSEDIFRKFVQEKGLKFVTANVVPNPNTSDIKIAQDFREAATKVGAPIDIFTFEGYIIAKLFAYVMGKVHESIAPESIIKQFEGIKDVDFEGLKLTFNPEQRALSDTLWLDTGEDNWIKQDLHSDMGVAKAAAPSEPKPEAAPEPEKKAAAPAKDLVMGVSLDLTKGAKVLGERLKAGLNLAFDQVNAAGGIDGQKTQLVVLDDEYTPEKARANVERIMKEFKTSIMFSPSGSPTVQAYLDLVKDGKLIVLFPNTGAPIFRKPELTYMLHFRPSYFEEGRALVNYAMKEMGASKYALFYQDDAYGQGALDGGRAALKAAGIGPDKFVEIPYKRNDVSFGDQAKKIKDEKADTILFYSTSIAAKGLINAVGVSTMVGKKLLGLSDLSEDIFRKFVQEKGLKFVTANVVPNPNTSDIKIAQDFREAATKVGAPVDIFTFEGYIIAKLFAYVMGNVHESIAPANIIKQFEGIKDVDFEGLKLSFNPEQRTLSDTLWLDTGEDNWIKQDLHSDMGEAKAASASTEKKAEAPAAEEKKAETSVQAEEKKEEPKPAAAPEQKPAAAPEQKPEAAPEPEKKTTVPGKDVVMGVSLDLTKGLKILGERLKAGLNLAFDQVNAAGGIDGQKVQLVILDDEYTPEKARANVERIMNEFKTPIMFSPSGSPTVQAYLDLVKDGKLIVLFPNTGAPIFRKPELTYMLHFRPSYFEEGKSLVDYAIKKMDASKYALFYQNDAYGQGALEGGRAALKAAGIGSDKFVEIPYKRNDVNFGDQAQKIKDALVDTVLFYSTSIAAKGLINAVGVNVMVGKKLLGLSDLGEDIFRKFVKEKGLKFVTANVVPNPNTSDIKIAQDFREAATKVGAPIDIFTFEGYIIAKLFAYVMGNVHESIAPANIIKQFEGIKDVDFEGLKLSFNPAQRTLSDTLWLDTGEDAWVKQDLHSDMGVAKAAAPSEPKPEAAPEPEKKAAAPAEGSSAPAPETGPITIGGSLDLSKGTKLLNMPYRQGYTMYFDELNTKGGINGREVRMIALDDGYDPNKARENIETLMSKHGVNIIFGASGTAPTQTYIDLIKEGKIIDLFPITGAPKFRVPELKNIVHIRPSYFEEGRTLAKYAVQKMQATKVMLFYQDDDQGSMPGAVAGFKEIGFTNYIQTPYVRNTVQFMTQIEKFKAEKCDTVIFLSSSLAAKEFIKGVGVSKMSTVKMLGFSDLGDSVFNDYMKETGLRIVVINAFPNPETSTMQIVQDYRALAQKNDAKIDIFGFEGYFCARLFAYLVEQVKGALTKESIIQAAENIHNLDFGGFPLDYDPQTHELSHTFWLNTGEPDWVMEKIMPAALSEKKDEAAPKVEEKKVAEAANQSTETKKTAQSEEKKSSEPQAPRDIKIGTTIDLSKGLKNLCFALKGGFNLFFDARGDQGDKISITVLDDGYTPETARKNVETLMSQFGVDTIFMPAGSQTVQSFLDLIKQGKILVLFPITGVTMFRSPDLKYMINLRPSYFEEGRTLAKYAVQTLGATKIMFFYQNDSFGKTGLDGARAGFKEMNFTNFFEVPYERNTVRFEPQVKKMEAERPDAICFFSTSIASKEFMKQVGVAQLSAVKILGMSDLADDVFNQFMKETGLKSVIVNAFPNPETSELAVVKEYRDAAAAKGLAVDIFGLEGYFGAKLFDYMIKQISGPVTKDALVQAAENIKNLDFGGINLNFNPKTRELSDTFWLNLGEPAWVAQKVQPAAAA